MNTYVGHTHALRLAREVRRSKEWKLVQSDCTVITPLPKGTHFSWDRFAIPELDSLSSFDGEQPCLLASCAADRIKAAGVRSLVVSGPLPEGSLLELRPKPQYRQVPGMRAGDAHYVAAPSLMLLTIAGSMRDCVRQGRISQKEAIVRLACIAMELCGTYARHHDEPATGMCAFRCSPIASAEQLREQLEGMPRRQGLPYARQAAQLIAGGSSSPMETLHYLMLCLPESYGGFGLPRAELNRRIDFASASHGMSSIEEMKPDLSWPDEQVAIEHLGSDWHTGDGALIIDARRIQDYQVSGWSVFPSTGDDTGSLFNFNPFARRVVSALDPTGARGIYDRCVELLHDAEFCRRQRWLFRLVSPPPKPRHQGPLSGDSEAGSLP